MSEVPEFAAPTIQIALRQFHPRYFSLSGGGMRNLQVIYKALYDKHRAINIETVREIVPSLETLLDDWLRPIFVRLEAEEGFQNTESLRGIVEHVYDGDGNFDYSNYENVLALANTLEQDDRLIPSERRKQILAGRQLILDEGQELSDLRTAEIARLYDSASRPKVQLGSATRSPASVAKERTQEINSLSLDELRARKAQRDANRALREAPVSELRKIVREEVVQKAQNSGLSQVYNRYEPIPDRYIPSYSAIGFEGYAWNSPGLLRKLPSLELKRILRLYGEQQIQDAIDAANAAQRS